MVDFGILVFAVLISMNYSGIEASIYAALETFSSYHTEFDLLKFFARPQILAKHADINLLSLLSSRAHSDMGQVSFH